MKTFLLPALFLAIVSAPAFAASGTGTGQAGSGQAGSAQDFEERKAEALKRIDEKIALLNDARLCVKKATSGEALKACREQFRDEKPERADRKSEHPNRNGSDPTRDGRD